MFIPAPFEITPEILNLIAAIDEFKGAWKASKPLPTPRLAALKHTSTIAGYAASARIEGRPLSDREVEAWLAKPAKASATPDHLDAAAYAGLLDRIFNAGGDIALTTHQIRRLHRELMHYPAKDPRSGYKTRPNDLPRFDETGHPLAAFATASPADTPRRMRDLVAWTDAELARRALHPLLVIAIFIAAFLEIRPFEEGTGRLSRLLTTLLMLQSGYTYVPYSSLEARIDDNKDDYYAAFSEIQGDPPTWLPWLSVFLGTLRQQTEVLATEMAAGHAMTADMPDLSVQIMTQVSRHRRVTLADMVALTGASRNTLKYHLIQLVEKRHLTLHGKGRGAWYGC